MSKCAAAEFGVDGRRVLVEDLVHSVERGVRWFAVNWWDGGVFEALHGLIYREGRHGGGEELNTN